MGLGANYYEPIARALEGINRQLNVNSDRADAREAKGLQRLLTASQLMTAQENRELNKRSSERSDRQLEESIKANIFSKKMQVNADLRDARKLKMQEEAFTAEKDKRKAEQEQYRQQVTPAPVNIYSAIGDTPRMRNMFADEYTTKQIEELYGPTSKFDPATGFIKDKITGKNMLISPVVNANKYGAGLSAILHSKLDPASVIRGDMTQLLGEIDSLEQQKKQYKSKSKGIDTQIKDKAETQVKINSLKAKLKRRANTSTDELIKLYEEQGNALVQFSVSASQQGASPALLNSFTFSLNRNKAMLDRLYRQKVAETKASLTGKLPKGIGPQEWAKVTKELRVSYFKQTPEGQFIKSAAALQKYNRALTLASEDLKNGAFGLDAVNRAKVKVDEDNTAYWKLFNDRLKKLGGNPSNPKERDLVKTVASLNKDGTLSNIKDRLGYVPVISGHPAYGENISVIKKEKEVKMTPKQNPVVSKPKKQKVMRGKPSASKYKGKLIKDENGVVYKSNGRAWVKQ